MVYLHTKNPNLGKFLRALEWKTLHSIFYGHLEYIFYGNLVRKCCGRLVCFPAFGMFYQEKSGNPTLEIYKD
jgi:hypothetical protein